MLSVPEVESGGAEKYLAKYTVILFGSKSGNKGFIKVWNIFAVLRLSGREENVNECIVEVTFYACGEFCSGV